MGVMKKRIWSIALAAVLLLTSSGIGSVVNAEEGAVSGTEVQVSADTAEEEMQQSVSAGAEIQETTEDNNIEETATEPAADSEGEAAAGMSGEIANRAMAAPYATSNQKIIASPDESIKSMYNVPITYYDYLDDNELTAGWGEQQPYGNNQSNGWSVFGKFNHALAEYYSKNGLTTTGVYFGNLLKSDKAGEGVGKTRAGEVEGQISGITSIYPNYWNNANNSNYLPGMKYSAQGLVYNTLDNEENLQIANGITAPWFNEEFLLQNGWGKVLSSRFPFRETKDANGVSYYEFDSNKAIDNVCYHYDTQTFSYGAGEANGVQDCVSTDWGLDTDSENGGYGFFPFNYKNGNVNDGWLDFGFGTKMEIRFNLPKGGKVNGVPVTFEFTGDDDVWIFIDGKLVLDLGGAHKKAQGTIDFSTLTTSITTGTEQINTGADMKAVSLQEALGVNSSADFTPNKSHKMTIFYMERGMIESNLKIRFNMQPLDHEFITEKEVDVANVNPGIQEVVKNADEFNVELKVGDTPIPAADKTYQLVDKDGHSTEKKTDTNGNFSLSDSEQAVFKKQFDEDIGKTFHAVETTKEGEGKSYLSYDTIWNVMDLENSDWITNHGETARAEFPYQKSAGDEFTPVRLKLKYKNTPKLGSMSVKKSTVDKDGKPYSDVTTDFTFKVELDMGITKEGGTELGDVTKPGTIYFKNTQNWNKVYAYCYNNDTEHNTKWPGQEMTLVETNEDGDVYKLETDTNGMEIRDNWKYVVFTDNDRNQCPEEGTNVKITNSASPDNCYYINGNTLGTEKYVERGMVTKPGETLGYKGYPLTYTVNGATRTAGTDGSFTLKSGETAVFNGIPIGTKFRIKETSSEGYSLKDVKITGSTGVPDPDGYYPGEITETNTDVTAEVINQKEETSVSIEAWKTVDEGKTSAEAGKFHFIMQGKSPEILEDGTWTENTSGVSLKAENDADGKISFGTLAYTKAGTYLYTIREENLSADKAYIYDQTVYQLKVVITAGDGTMNKEVTVTRIKDKKGNLVSPPENVNLDNGIKFDNTTNLGTLTVQKMLVKEDGSKLEKASWPNPDVKFKFKLEVRDGAGHYNPCIEQEYQIVGADGQVVKYKTDTEGIFELSAQELDSEIKAEFLDLQVGNVYRVTEILSGMLDYECHSIQVDGQSIVKVDKDRTYAAENITIVKEGKSVIYKNYPLSEIEILKQDADGKPLFGAEFTLEKQKDDGTWESVGTKQTSDTSGKASFKYLHAGTYRITEVKTPDGNVLLKEPVVVKLPYEYNAGDIVNGSEVTADGTSYKVKFTIINDKAFDLPASGRKGIIPFLVVGVAVAITAGSVLGMRTVPNRRRRRRHRRHSR